MGTDIHPAVEVKINDKWIWLGGLMPTGVNPYAACPVDHGRNYTLFAVLAGVRNGYGFAGCYRHEPITPIAEPRGVPTDMSPQLKLHYEEGGLGDHSFSWVTAKELHDYDWDQPLSQGGVVSAEEYDEFIQSGRKQPKRFSGGISGRDIITLDEEEFLIHKAAGILSVDKRYYVNITWNQPLRDAVGFDSFWSWSELMFRIKDYSDDNPIQDVRVVFGFDS